MYNEINRNRFFEPSDVFKSDNLKVIDATPVFEYINNELTNNRIATYLIVVDLNDYSKYRIKFPLEFSAFEYLNKEISVADFVDFKATLYCRSNKIYWSVKANGLV